MARISAFKGPTATRRPSASSVGARDFDAHVVVVAVEALGVAVREEREVGGREREVLLREAERDLCWTGHGASFARRLVRRQTR